MVCGTWNWAPRGHLEGGQGVQGIAPAALHVLWPVAGVLPSSSPPQCNFSKAPHIRWDSARGHQAQPGRRPLPAEFPRKIALSSGLAVFQHVHEAFYVLSIASKFEPDRQQADVQVPAQLLSPRGL